MKQAFTMIELIFAIVIIAITVISLPMMMQVNAKGIEGNIAQEAIFAAATKLMQVGTYPWDEHSINSTTPFTQANIVDFNASTTNHYLRLSNNAADINSSYRVGHVQEDGHRRFHSLNDANTTVSPLGSGGGNGINDQIGTYSFAFDAASSTGYKEQYRSVVNISYIPDTGTPYVFKNSGTSSPTNMKLIEVSIQKNVSGTWEDVTLLRSYAANIGEVVFHSRTY